MIDNGWKNGYYRYMEEAEFTVTGSSQKYSYDGSAQLKYVSLDKKYIKTGDELTITAKIDPGTADVKYIDAHIQGGRGGGGPRPINYSLGDDSSTVRLLSVGNNTFEKTITVPDYWNSYDGLYTISICTLDGSEWVEVGFHNDNDFETGIVEFGHIEGSYSLKKDEELQLDSNFWTDTPDYYQWKSSDESIAEVDEHGLVKAVGEGKCYIHYVYKDFDFKTDTAWEVYEIEVIKKNDLFTGVKKVNGQLKRFRSDEVDTAYTGLDKYPEDGKWYYFAKGVHDSSYTGFAKSTDGKWYYAKNGVWDKTYTGFAKSVDGKWCFARNGKYDNTYTGLAKNASNGDWFYAKNGIYKTGYTGLAKYTDGKWYYVKNGTHVPTYTGITPSTDGKLYYAKNGVWDKTFTGKVKDASGNEVNIKNGRVV